MKTYPVHINVQSGVESFSDGAMNTVSFLVRGRASNACLSTSRSEAEIELMRTLKTALDPDNILNPGKVIDVAAR